jgi:hypothetical protein
MIKHWKRKNIYRYQLLFLGISRKGHCCSISLLEEEVALSFQSFPRILHLVPTFSLFVNNTTDSISRI